MEQHTIFFVGKPGSGKGTQAKLLSQTTGWPILVTSDGLRAIATDDSVIGRKLKETMEAGILTPSWFPTYVFFKSLFALKETDSAIFDGFNRKVEEAKLIRDSLHWIGRPFTVLYLSVSDETVRARLALRKEAEGRVDDHAVDRRLEEYYAHTIQSIDLYREMGEIIELDGEAAPEVITAEIKKALGIA